MYTIITTAICNISPSRQFNYKWAVGLIMATVIALGWKFPLLGFIVPFAMGVGILGGFFRGRWVCGNLCPRGSFLDTWFNLISAKKAFPSLFKGNRFRWIILIILMGFMAFRLAQNPADIEHWGLVFWQMCLITSLAAFWLGLRYHARSWCSFCPVGTIASSIGGDKHLLQVHSSCKACGHCEKSCPMQLSISGYRQTERLQEKDCLKCSACISACPHDGVLSWPVKETT